MSREYDRNSERYSLLKWAQGSFRNLRVFPPGKGICHQVNLEYPLDRRRPQGNRRKARGPPRHARRNGLPHDHGERAGSARMGGGRHRGRGGHARRAVSHADTESGRSEASRPVARKEPRPPTSCSPSPSSFEGRTSSTHSSSTSARGISTSRCRTGRRWGTCPRSTARPSASRQWTPLPSVTSSTRGGTPPT